MFYICCKNNTIHNEEKDNSQIEWNTIHQKPSYVNTIYNPMLVYHPPPKAEPNAPPPTEFAAIGSNDSIPIPIAGVAAPTKGVLSC